MYEPITVEVDRGYGDGAHRSTPINFTGRLLKTVEGGRTTMRLYEWADRGRLVYLVHVVEEGKPGRPPRRTLYPFINTHSAGAATTKGYTAEEVSRAYPDFERKCHDGGVRRLRDFASMADFFSDREIDELQAAIDARRGGRRGEHPRPASKEATDRPAAPLSGGPPPPAPDR